MRIDAVGGSPYLRSVRESDSVIEPGRIGSIDRPQGLPGSTGVGSGQSPQTAFGDVLSQAIDKVNGLQVDADRQAEAVATGDAQDLHTAMIAMERADIALQATVQITQKAIDAYREVSRMQV